MAMSKASVTTKTAEQVRREYRVSQTKRLAGINADPAPPEVVGIVDPADGTLNKDVLQSDLTVTLQEWDQLPVIDGDLDTVFLEWAAGATPVDKDYEVVAQMDIVAPVPAGTFPLSDLKVPQAKLAPDGPYSLRYRIRSYNGGELTSPPLGLICDSIPPWGRNRPQAITLPAGPITEDFLTANPLGLVGNLPKYDDWEPRDQVAYFWITHPLPDKPADLPPPIAVIPVATQLQEVTFPLSVIRDSKDTDYYAFYVLFDKATNASLISDYVKFDVALGALPDNLKDPQVPLAADGLVDLQDARLGVKVEILEFDNGKPTDRIEVTWGTAVLGSEDLGFSPIFPLQILVPQLVLRDSYVAANGGVQPVNVSYRVLRGAVASEVKSITVNVDFSVIGPDPVPDPDPDWPDPVNDQLLPAEVFGKASATLNTLTRADAGQPAELTFTLYTPVNDGEVIDFYWATEKVAEAQVIVSGQLADEKITVEIPWSYIDNAGNDPALPVHYRIHAAGSDNDQYSPTTLVDVDAITITPDAPTFPDINSGWLNCNSLYYADPDDPQPGEPAIRVQVPDLSQYLLDGQQVTLSWVPRERASGTELTDLIKTEEITLNSTTVKGFIWLVQPYEDHIGGTYIPGGSIDAIAKIQYQFKKGTEDIFSKIGENNVGMHSPGGACDILPPKP